MRSRTKFIRIMRWLVTPLAILALVTQAAPPVRADDPFAELNKQKDKLQYIQDQKRQATSAFERINWEAAEAQAKLDEADQELGVANAQLAVISNQYAAAQKELERIEANLTVAQAHYEKRKDQLAKRVRAINENGRVNYLGVLLGSSSFTDFISRYDMLKVVVAKDAELFETVRQEKKDLEDQKQVAESQRNQLALLKAQAEERHSVVERKRSERDLASRSLDDRKRQLQDQLDDFERQASGVQDQIAEIQARLNRPAGRFSPIYPVNRPIIVTDSFGPRIHPVLHTPNFHTGTDFNARMGDPISAAEDGVVIMTEWNDGYGNLVVIDHGGGIATWYAHNSQFLVHVGDTVKQGQQIAKAGSTGRSTGPHCHFEIRVNGQPQNPMNYLP